jgi:hypothetical protein
MSKISDTCTTNLFEDQLQLPDRGLDKEVVLIAPVQSSADSNEAHEELLQLSESSPKSGIREREKVPGNVLGLKQLYPAPETKEEHISKVDEDIICEYGKFPNGIKYQVPLTYFSASSLLGVLERTQLTLGS